VAFDEALNHHGMVAECLTRAISSVRDGSAADQPAMVVAPEVPDWLS